MYALGIDLGTTFTAAAVWRDGRAEVSSLGSRAAAIPSVVVLREDETIITGETAQRRALTSPHRVAREFKRRLGDTTPILLAGVPYSAEALMARMLSAVVDEVSAREGGPPDLVCVSHPANWGPYKTDLLQQAVRRANLETARFTIEPVAAAVFYARQQRLPDDAVIAVYDLGGGTFDAAVLRKTATGFEVLGRPEGIERLGGIDFDAAVYAHVSRALGGALEELDDEDPAAIAAVARLKDECTQAKEALSTDTDTTIPVLLPHRSTEVRLTRAELESMVRPALQDTIDALRRALRSAGVTPEQLHSVLLVGGSSRMPIVSQLVGAELGRPVAVDAHPKHAVALGAAMVAGAALSEAPEPVAPAMVAAEPVAPERVAPVVVAEPVAREQAAPTPTPTPALVPTATPTPAARSSAATPVADASTEIRQIKETQVFPAVTDRPPTPTSAARPSPVRPVAAVRPVPAARPVAPARPSPVSPSVQASTGLGAAAQQRTPAASRRGRLLAASAAAAVIVIALGAAAFAALQKNKDDDLQSTSQGSVNATTAPGKAGAAGNGLPADEQCTDEIKANPRWVCLTSATFKGETLTIEYKANFAGAAPNVHGGYHLHIYGGDGVTPAAEDEGGQSMAPGEWYVEDEKPSVRKASSKDYQRTIGDAPKVCARIATANHFLVQDAKGTYVTGNCIPINRDGFSAGTTRSTKKPEGSSSSGHSTGTATPTTSPTPTPTWTPTDLTWSPASMSSSTPSPS